MACISDLPQPIVHHILSFLTTREGSKAAVLSKEWLRSWRTRPVLDFDADFVRSKKQPFDHVIRTLLRYRELKISSLKLSLTIDRLFCSDCYSDIVDRCVGLAAESGVGTLFLSLPLNYTLPRMVFEAKSLVGLTLFGGRLKNPTIMSDDRLKELRLRSVRLDRVILTGIMRSFPSIEILEINCCDGLEHFKVTDLQKLKRLRAAAVENVSVEVGEAPNLESVELRSLKDEEPAPQPTALMGRRKASFRYDFSASEYRNLKSLFLKAVEINEDLLDGSEIPKSGRFDHPRLPGLGEDPSLESFSQANEAGE